MPPFTVEDEPAHKTATDQAESFSGFARTGRRRANQGLVVAGDPTPPMRPARARPIRHNSIRSIKLLRARPGRLLH